MSTAPSTSKGEVQAIVATREELVIAQNIDTASASIHAEATASLAITSSYQHAGRDIHNTVTNNIVNNTFNINQKQDGSVLVSTRNPTWEMGNDWELGNGC